MSDHPTMDEANRADPLYMTAAMLVTETRRASIAGLQRQLKIGYNRAASMIETMEADGIVSAPNHKGERRVLVGARTGESND